MFSRGKEGPMEVDPSPKTRSCIFQNEENHPQPSTSTTDTQECISKFESLFSSNNTPPPVNSTMVTTSLSKNSSTKTPLNSSKTASSLNSPNNPPPPLLPFTLGKSPWSHSIANSGKAAISPSPLSSRSLSFWPPSSSSLHRTSPSAIAKKLTPKKRLLFKDAASLPASPNEENSSDANSCLQIPHPPLAFLSSSSSNNSNNNNNLSSPNFHPQSATKPRINHFHLLYLFMGYLQLAFNAFIVILSVYLILQFFWTIKRDVDLKVEGEMSAILAEISQCSRQYLENRCHPETRVPAMEKACAAWEACMSRDPKVIGRAKVSAMAFAEIINSFVEPISFKTLLFVAVIGGTIFGVGNVVLGAARAREWRNARALESGIAASASMPSTLLQEESFQTTTGCNSVVVQNHHHHQRGPLRSFTPIQLYAQSAENSPGGESNSNLRPGAASLYISPTS